MKSIKYSVFILERAKEDLRDVRKYYNLQQQGLGSRFLKEIKLKIKDIQLNPLGFQLRYRTVRMAHLSVFPYSIHFEIMNNTIVILAITHCSISPDKWVKMD